MAVTIASHFLCTHTHTHTQTHTHANTHAHTDTSTHTHTQKICIVRYVNSSIMLLITPHETATIYRLHISVCLCVHLYVCVCVCLCLSVGKSATWGLAIFCTVYYSNRHTGCCLCDETMMSLFVIMPASSGLSPAIWSEPCISDLSPAHLIWVLHVWSESSTSGLSPPYLVWALHIWSEPCSSDLSPPHLVWVLHIWSEPSTSALSLPHLVWVVHIWLVSFLYRLSATRVWTK